MRKPTVHFDSVPDELKKLVFDFWLKETENSSAKLAKKYDLSQHVVIRIINEGLSNPRKTTA